VSTACNSALSLQGNYCISKQSGYILNWDIQTKTKPVQKQLFVTLDDDEQKVYDYLLKTGKELLDIIALRCDFPIYRMSGMLLNMELKGVIRPLPGNLFEAI
jgi:DNA processing protein